MKPKEKPHYVSNKDFSNAVHEYCTTVKEAKEKLLPSKNLLSINIKLRIFLLF